MIRRGGKLVVNMKYSVNLCMPIVGRRILNSLQFLNEIGISSLEEG